jgi:hypothetical protein
MRSMQRFTLAISQLFNLSVMMEPGAQSKPFRFRLRNAFQPRHFGESVRNRAQHRSGRRYARDSAACADKISSICHLSLGRALRRQIGRERRRDF